jgi:hypothetical protein
MNPSEAYLAELGLSHDQLIASLGGARLDVYVNYVAYWRCVPARVWKYTIGSYTPEYPRAVILLRIMSRSPNWGSRWSGFLMHRLDRLDKTYRQKISSV